MEEEELKLGCAVAQLLRRTAAGLWGSEAAQGPGCSPSSSITQPFRKSWCKVLGDAT